LDRQKKNNPSFEEAFTRLNQTVEKLEAGGLSLEEATKLFEDGMHLAQLCHQLLTKAELKVTQLKNAYTEYINASKPGPLEGGRNVSKTGESIPTRRDGGGLGGEGAQG
jgi:exodeoxyribonuclease VII small subunit